MQQCGGALAIGRATVPDRGIALSAIASGFATLAVGRDAVTVSTTPPIAKNPPTAVKTLGTWPSQNHAITDATSGCTYRKLDTFDAGARESAKFHKRYPMIVGPTPRYATDQSCAAGTSAIYAGRSSPNGIRPIVPAKMLATVKPTALVRASSGFWNTK